MKNQVVIYAELETDYYRNKQRPQQISERLAENNIVIFLEVPHSPLLALFKRELKKTDRKGNHKKGLRRDKKLKNLYLYCPPPTWFPFTRIPLINKLYFKLLISGLQRELIKYSLEPTILWLCQPTAFPLAEKYKNLPVVVDWTNPWEERALNYINRNSLTKRINLRFKRYWIEKLLNKADIIFANAIKYYQYALNYNPNTHLFFSGTDLKNFTGPGRDIDTFDIEDLKSPIIGVVAARIHEDIIDMEAITYSALKHPEWTFVFIGEKTGDIRELEQLPNTRFLGYKEHSQLSAYLASFDVNLIPYRVNTLTQSGIPTKLPEYLALGKPVVSTYLEEIAQSAEFNAITYMAKGPEEFCSKIEQALREDTRDKQNQRRNLACKYDWDIIVSDMCGLLDKHLKFSYEDGLNELS